MSLVRLALVIACVIAVGGIAFAVFDHDTVQSIFAFLTFLAALGGLWLARVTIRENEKIQKRQRSFQIVDRLNQPEINKAKLFVRDRCVALEECPQKIADEMSDLGDLRSQMFTMIDHLEDTAIAMKQGLVDEDLIKNSIGPWFPLYWKRVSVWLVDERTTYGPQQYEHLQDIAKEWKDIVR